MATSQVEEARFAGAFETADGPRVLCHRRVRVWAGAVLAIVLLLCLQAWIPSLCLWPESKGGLGPGFVLVVFLAALFCEYIDSSLGMGYGTTLTPLLLLAGFEPLQIVPAVLLSEFVTGLAAGAMHHRDGNVDLIGDRRVRSTVVLLSSLSVAGALAAVVLALHIPKFWLQGIIAIIILSVGVVILATIRHQLRYRRRHMVTLGVVAAFNKGLSGGGYGPLVTAGQVVFGMPAKQAVSITSLCEGLTCLVGLSAYMVLGGGLHWALAIPLTVGAVMSVPMATLTVRRMPEKAMRAGMGVAMCCLGAAALLKLVW